MGKGVRVWTDLYSAGVMAWEHVVGGVPFLDESPTVVLRLQVNQRILSAIELRAETDPPMSRPESTACWSSIRVDVRATHPRCETSSRRS
jgi:hypothetical protein